MFLNIIYASYMTLGSNRFNKKSTSFLGFLNTGLLQNTMVYTLLLVAIISLNACSDSIQKMQADIYDEYTGKIKDVEEYDSLKKLNGELNNELITLFRENSEQLLKESKNSNKEDVKALKEAEKAYVESYIGKIAPLIIQKKNSAYDNAIAELSKCTSSPELTSLNSRIYNEIKKLDKENSWELKVIGKKYIKDLLALNTKSSEYNTLYIKTVTPFIVEEVNRYTGLANQAEGYEDLKDVKNEFHRRMNMFCTPKDTILNTVFHNKEALETLLSTANCKEEIKSMISAEAEFDSVYMNKFLPCYLEKEKELYEGVIKVLERSNDKQLLKDIEDLFPGIQKNFYSINVKEKRWLENKLKVDSTAFKEYVLPRDEALLRMNTLYNEKMRGSK